MKKVALLLAGSRLMTSIAVGLVCLLVSIAVFMVAPSMADGEKNAELEWKQYKSKDGIIGYKRNVDGSKYFETRAETVADFPIEILLDVLVDIPSYPQWMHACKAAVLLKQEGELKRELYFAQGVPLGSPDRETVIRAITRIDWDTIQVETVLDNVYDHPYQHPVGKNARERQKMKVFKGVWDLAKLDTNRTKVIYTAYTDPGGFAPRFVVNKVIRKVSFESVQGMLSMAKQEKYQAASVNGDAEWKQYKSEDGVTGYQRDVDGSMFPETRAETVIEAPIGVLREVLKDIASYPQWMYECREAFVLKKEGSFEREVYFVQGVPMGYPGHEDLDRDTVITAETVENKDKNRVVTTLQSIDNHPYQRSKKEYNGRRQRMIKFKGVWDLESLEGNRTKAVFTAYTEPGGLAPKYMVKNMVRNVSFESLKGLMQMAKNEKYVTAAKKEAK
jgi:ribosome-associated toxin RatA of RatAB toxin-antitoxin module